MVGIISYGGYIPQLRLDRMAIMKSMGWFAPNLGGLARGTRSMCNWDEDTLTMAVAAGQDCLSGLDKQAVDAVYLASTSLPFNDRDNAGVMKTALNIRDQVVSADFASSLKCGTTALITALEAVKGSDRNQILVAASDHRLTKVASNQEMIYGDGAAALLVGEGDVIAEFLGSYSVSYDFIDHYRGQDEKFDYNWEERWVRDDGFAKIYPEAINGLLEKTGTSIGDIAKLVYPCRIKRAHLAIPKLVGAEPEISPDNMHEETGDCGAAHALIMLVRELERAKPGDKIIVAGFGQGADALLFQVTDKINKLPQRNGISGSLENKVVEETYTKFLHFNNMLNIDMGIRDEVPRQTALTTLWRKRKFILGFIGGTCSECGTAQIPKTRICVNPDCGAVDTQEDTDFTEREAKVLTFTADMLAASMSPPAIYGMVEFVGGGRIMMDFTDCGMDDVEVGVSLKLSFRKKYLDTERGFTGYFWKAIPQNS